MPSSPMPSGARWRPLTVLQVVPALETGGAERATVDIAAALAERGDRALVASVGGRLSAELTAAGGTLVPLPADTKNPLRLGMLALRLAQLIRREKVDIVHARSRAPAWAARLACRITGVPFVTTFHGIYGEKSATKHHYNSVMAAGDVVIANSQYTAGLITERYGTAPERIVVIPRGTDPERFDPNVVGEERRQALRHAWKLSGDETLVLNLARLTGWKGQTVLVEAASLPPLAERDRLVLVLAGDEQGRAGYRQALEQSIAAHDLTKRARIVGHCADTPAALALAAVAVIASTEPEAFGRAAIEAAAMSIPVVATALGATSETVLAPPQCPAAERTGWLVPPGDPVALAAAIDAALSLPPTERQQLAERARQHAMRFTTQAMQEATLAVYDRLMSPSRVGERLSKG
jgi:glycosyltransferase involved in cell wall biosynthesis